MLRFVFVFLIGLLCLSCSFDDYPGDERPLDEVVVKEEQSIFKVPIDQAMSILQNYLEAERKEAPESADIQVRKVRNIETLKLNKVLTKSLLDELDCDELLYLVNFEDDKGYAILSADSRIKEPILAVTEEGSISMSEMQSALESGTRKIFPQYPIFGPGIVYLDEDSTNSAINPNVFQLYDSEANDFFVGDLVVDEEPIPNQNSPVVNELIVDYTLNQIIEHDSLPDLPDYPFITTEESYYSYFEEHVSNMLHFASRWSQTEYKDAVDSEGQDSMIFQFNKYHRTVKNFWGTKSKRADVGCFPLAIGKILSYHGKMMLYPTYDYVIPWSVFSHSIFSYRQYIDILARGLKYIGDGCHANYWYNGTFVFPFRAVNFMDGFFNNVDKISYNTSRVVQMLESNKPIIVYSIPDGGWINYDISNSHAWNIDGYKTLCNVTVVEEYMDGELIDVKSYTDRVIMVHCDFGWTGSRNGFFVSGIFDLASEDVIYDHANGDEYDDNLKDHNQNFKWYLHILTYDL